MRQKGTEKDRIVGKNRIEGRRTDGNGQRRTENVREEILHNTHSSSVSMKLARMNILMQNVMGELLWEIEQS